MNINDFMIIVGEDYKQEQSSILEYTNILIDNWYDSIDSINMASNEELTRIGLPEQVVDNIKTTTQRLKSLSQNDTPIKVDNHDTDLIEKIVNSFKELNKEIEQDDFDIQSLKTITTLLKNILEHPNEEKYRMFRLSNKNILNIFRDNMDLVFFFKSNKFKLTIDESQINNLNKQSSYYIQIEQNELQIEETIKSLEDEYNFMKNVLQIRGISIPDLDRQSSYKSNNSIIGKPTVKDEVNRKSSNKQTVKKEKHIENDIDIFNPANDTKDDLDISINLISNKDNTPIKIENRQLKIFQSKSLGDRLNLNVEKIEPTEKIEISKRKSVQSNSIVKIINLTIILNKDLKIEMLASIKESFDQIYEQINSIINYKNSQTLFMTPPNKKFKKSKVTLEKGGLKSNSIMRVEWDDTDELNSLVQNDFLIDANLVEQHGSLSTETEYKQILKDNEIIFKPKSTSCLSCIGF